MFATRLVGLCYNYFINTMLSLAQSIDLYDYGNMNKAYSIKSINVSIVFASIGVAIFNEFWINHKHTHTFHLFNKIRLILCDLLSWKRAKSSSKLEYWKRKINCVMKPVNFYLLANFSIFLEFSLKWRVTKIKREIRRNQNFSKKLFFDRFFMKFIQIGWRKH